jgi:hypothetical protein
MFVTDADDGNVKETAGPSSRQGTRPRRTVEQGVAEGCDRVRPEYSVTATITTSTPSQSHAALRPVGMCHCRCCIFPQASCQ